MLSKYSESQKIFYDYFSKSASVSHLSHAYLIETKHVSYSFNLALDLAKFFLCNGIYDEKICKLVDSGNYPNLKIIGKGGSVKKEEIVSLKTDFSMKSVDDKRQVYILCNVQNLNKSSANSLLKFLEEPEEDVIAILLCDSISNVLSTIVSRCQNISLIDDNNVYDSVFTAMYDSDSGVIYDDFINENVNKFFDIYEKFEKSGVSILSDLSIYDLKDNMREFLWFGYYLYFDVLNYLLKRDIKCSQFNLDIKKISEKNSARDIIEKMEIINRFIIDIKYNVNINLFIDNFFICMGSV